MSTAGTSELTQASKLGAYIALTKPDVSFLVLMTTAAGFYMGVRGAVDWLHMLHVVIGTMMIAAGTAALNHYIERETDSTMRRTASRPLPSGQLTPGEALRFGVLLCVAGAVDLAITGGLLPCVLGVFTCLSYLLAYTPLKKHTVWATFIGAIPGAIPPMIGWTAATGKLDTPAWLLFAILFFWQFPHFHSIAWMYREDYARAGILMLPVVDKDGTRTFRQIILYAASLVAVSLLPAIMGFAGRAVFLWGAGELHGAGAGVLVGGEFQVQPSRQVADARYGDAHSDFAGADDVRQDSAVRWDRLVAGNWLTVIRYQLSAIRKRTPGAQTGKVLADHVLSCRTERHAEWD